MWVEDPRDPSRHHVRHYFIDFGKSLGAMALINRDHRRGYTYGFDPRDMVASLFTAGWHVRPWAERTREALRGVGLYTARRFDPGRWKPHTPAYLPFLTADRIDQLWAARILIRFTRDQLRAAVEGARFSDPRTTEHLTGVLIERQRAVARYWLSRSSALDGFRLTTRGSKTVVCFEDLLLAHQLLRAHRTTTYVVEAAGSQVVVRPDATGRVCTQPIELPATGDGYTIVRIETRRRGLRAPVELHLARGPGGPRLIGIWRS